MKKLLLIFLIFFSSQLLADPSGEGIVCYDRIEKDAVRVVFIDNFEYELYFVQDNDVTTTRGTYAHTTHYLDLFTFKNKYKYIFIIDREVLNATHTTSIKDNDFH